MVALPSPDMTPEHSPLNDRLQEYRAKRSPIATPEPFGGTEMRRHRTFVVQKHAATRLHYDLRLEHDGVLMSWAVPAGISLDPKVKRFAAHTEDHPLEYADFEGVIPAAEYGGGEMVVWDRGALTWDEEPDLGLEKGKLLFSLAGYKLRGQWTLVQMKKNPKEWLLIKKPDGWHTGDGEEGFSERSVLSGLTVEQLKGGVDRSDLVTEVTSGEGAIQRDVEASAVELMLAATADVPFNGDNWLFEIKYDGYRLLASKNGRMVRLLYRGGGDATDVFPEIASAIRRLPFDRLIIDGEVVVLGADGKPSFGRLQSRGMLRNRHDVGAAAGRNPATFFGFDVIEIDHQDVRRVPLRLRKTMLEKILPPLGPLRYVDHLVGVGEAMFEQAVHMGLEGVMAKKLDSPYVGGRSDSWLKVKSEHTDTFGIVGYTLPKGRRTGIGALHIGCLVDGVMTYAGRVGSGIPDSTLKDLAEALSADVTASPRVEGDTPEGAEHFWVEPSLACRIRYKEVTSSGVLRQPVFEEFIPLDLEDVLARPGSSSPPAPSVQGAARTDVTNRDKVFWPEDEYTKGDLIDYYEAVADHLLPYLVDRPIVLDRYPDGINGKSFFQKNAPESTPSWMRTEHIGDGDGSGTNYFVVDDVEGLRYLANLASIPIHLWASTTSSLDSPDWCVLDLDPKVAPFRSVVTVAKKIHDICTDIGLPTYPKTSGKTGLHVLIPMGRKFTYEQQKLLGELIARVTESELSDIATTVRSPSMRGEKVYIDYLQNGKGKLLVSPYSVRPVTGATVSTPLRWKEVTPSLDVSRFTIRSMPRRLSAMASDPIARVLEDVPDIAGGLDRLANR
jgi:bifunctional non-homologous end joining protein LigD